MAHGRKRMLILGSALGAAIAYWFDADNGRGRRTRARDQMAAAARRRGRDAGRKLRYGLSNLEGRAQRAAYERTYPIALDDVTLAAKVKTELFAPADVPKGKISVDVAHGIATLRGEVGDDETILRLERAVRQVNGVRGVECLLHLPGEPAPNTLASRRRAL